ncbi:Hypothetical protein BIBO2_2145 [Brucella sp. BO2]|nr:Hypothetical protein BIBO1_2769 [Brucella inopinata BO1]EFM58974.1 Hypothetical protein BIBO2_2145 [Brucella sp. BO2]
MTIVQAGTIRLLFAQFIRLKQIKAFRMNMEKRDAF